MVGALFDIFIQMALLDEAFYLLLESVSVFSVMIIDLVKFAPPVRFKCHNV